MSSTVVVWSIIITVIVGSLILIAFILYNTYFKVSESNAAVAAANDFASRFRGKKGQDGYDGINGKDGLDGIDGNNGLSGIDGKKGMDGMNGEDGLDGLDGADGEDGADGLDGVDGKHGETGEDGKLVRGVAPVIVLEEISDGNYRYRFSKDGEFLPEWIDLCKSDSTESVMVTLLTESGTLPSVYIPEGYSINAEQKHHHIMGWNTS